MSVTVAVAVVPAVMGTGSGRTVLTATVAVAPLVGSVIVQVDPTGISLKVWLTDPVVPASMVNVNW